MPFPSALNCRAYWDGWDEFRRRGSSDAEPLT